MLEVVTVLIKLDLGSVGLGRVLTLATRTQLLNSFVSLTDRDRLPNSPLYAVASTSHLTAFSSTLALLLGGSSHSSSSPGALLPNKNLSMAAASSTSPSFDRLFARTPLPFFLSSASRSSMVRIFGLGGLSPVRRIICLSIAQKKTSFREVLRSVSALSSFSDMPIVSDLVTGGFVARLGRLAEGLGILLSGGVFDEVSVVTFALVSCGGVSSGEGTGVVTSGSVCGDACDDTAGATTGEDWVGVGKARITGLLGVVLEGVPIYGQRRKSQPHLEPLHPRRASEYVFNRELQSALYQCSPTLYVRTPLGVPLDAPPCNAFLTGGPVLRDAGDFSGHMTSPTPMEKTTLSAWGVGFAVTRREGGPRDIPRRGLTDDTGRGRLRGLVFGDFWNDVWRLVILAGRAKGW
jgi:hypothetical protein